MKIQDTLSRRISAGRELTETEQEQLLEIIGSGCHAKTKRMIERALRCVPDIESYGIFDRVHLDPPVGYCAGQSYPDEMRTLRKCLIGR